jgi:hypothetical protein
MESCEPTLADDETVGEDGTPGFVAGLEVEATADPFASLRDDNKEGGDSEEGAAAASAASASRTDCLTISQPRLSGSMTTGSMSRRMSSGEV